MSLPPGTYQPATVSLLDAGNEIGTMSFFGSVLTAGNIVAKTTAFLALVAAIEALTLGVKAKTRYQAEVTFNAAQPVNGAAREIKLLVQYRDATTGAKYTTTVPTLDPALPDYVINVNARDVIVLDAPAEITDFIDAFEAFAVNPLTGNAIAVYGLKVVGRSN